MTLSLYQKLAISLSLLFVAVAFVFVSWTAVIDKQTKQKAEQQLHAQLALHLVNDNPLLSQGVTDYAALENLFHMQMVLGPSFEFYFVDPYGTLLTYSAEPGKVKRPQIDLSPIVQFISGDISLPLFGDDPRSEHGKKIFSAAPVFSDEKLQGYLYVIIGGEIYESVFTPLLNDQSLKETMAIVIVSLLLLFVLLLVLFKRLTKPIEKLNQEIHAFIASSFQMEVSHLHQWNKTPLNEVEKLGKSVYELAKTIEEQIKQLRKNDDERRELLAHLSHDLRTPLSSIQGYIETLSVQENKLTEQNRKDYLSVALKSAHQLRRLIDQIFELAHIESGQIKVDCEVFPLSELLYDIAAKFSMSLQEKQIELVISPDTFDFTVYSDIGKLERILTNLIENAIRHSKEGHQIRLEVKPLTKGKITLQVIDQGTGIAEHDIPYIFDTRYRGANAIGSKQAHGGMGLAIASRLCQLLRSDIKVESEMGKGTQFSFDLSIAQ